MIKTVKINIPPDTYGTERWWDWYTNAVRSVLDGLRDQIDWPVTITLLGEDELDGALLAEPLADAKQLQIQYRAPGCEHPALVNVTIRNDPAPTWHCSGCGQLFEGNPDGALTRRVPEEKK